MIQTELVQDRGLEVVDGNGIFRGEPADLVGCSVAVTAFEATARHQHGEGLGMVVTSGVGEPSRTVFPQRGAAEFRTPDDKGGVEQSPLFQILDERGDRLIDRPGIVGEVLVELGMLVPARVDDVDETHPALDHAAGEKTVPCERVVGAQPRKGAAEVIARRLGTIDSIHRERLLRLA